MNATSFLILFGGLNLGLAVVLWLVIKRKKKSVHHDAPVTQPVLEPQSQPQPQLAPQPQTPATPNFAPTPQFAGPVTLNPALVKQLEDKALKQLEWRVAMAVKDFDAGLTHTAGTLNQKLTGLISTVIEREMTAYKNELAKARIQATKSLEHVQSAADELQSRQHAEMIAELEQEKQSLVKKLDQKLSDVLASYLIESLGKEIDLGAQSKYLLAMLDKNKAKLKKDILDEA